MFNFWQELKRRNVIKAAIAYLAISWLILQVFSIVLPSINAPDWVIRLIMLFIAIGFPLWILFAWVYEVTPEGLKKTSEVDKDKSISEQTKKRLDIFIVLALISIIVIALFKPETELFKTDDGKFSIAVLYFDNMSADGDNAWISDGMTESISTKLERNKNLLVTGRTSVKQFKSSDESIPEIANKLGVSYVLEGSVRAHNNKALITAQLINKKDEHIWANEYNVNLDNILDVQSSIAGQIVDELRIVLTPQEKQELQYKVTDNIEAYKLYQKGRTLADDRSKDGLEKSIKFYKEAIALDPKFSEAYAEIGNSYYLMGSYRIMDKEESITKAEQFIEKAFAIDSNTVRALTVKANLLRDKKNWDNARKYFEMAIELNPNDATAYHHFGIFFKGKPKPDYENFLKQSNKAQRLDPLSIPINANKLWALIYLEKLDEAEKHWNKISFIFPENWVHYGNEILERKGEKISIEKKDWSELVHLYEEALKDQPQNYRLSRMLAMAYDGILNDNENYIKFSKKAYGIDSTRAYIIFEYCFALIEGRKFIEAENLMNSKNFQDLMNKKEIQFSSWYYHYNKGDYRLADQVLRDSIFDKDFDIKLLTMAQLGNVNEVYAYFDKNQVDNMTKSFVFAILKERDSMYHYMNKEDIDAQLINSRFEFDPYRKEERFKVFLKKNYLPLTHWNE